ncbi:MAG: carboxypeptidase regulatory-like domain-containing protein [Nitrospirae bacterium]|nr:carboxypeptidase regulatory-like domain-containing protein [Nitrospirota bacterium]
MKHLRPPMPCSVNHPQSVRSVLREARLPLLPLLLTVLCSLFTIPACGDDEEAGITAPAGCEWTDACPTGWKKSGNTCEYTAGATTTIEGNVAVFSFNSPVANAVVKVQNFGTELPACGVSDAAGLLKIEGVPTNIDPTLAAKAPDAFLGKPTYTFHADYVTSLAGPITGATVYVINDPLAKIFLPALGITTAPPSGRGFVAGATYDAAENPIGGITASASSTDAGTKTLYTANNLPNTAATESDASGQYILAGLPVGETTITVSKGGAAIGNTKAIVYDQAVTLASVVVK